MVAQSSQYLYELTQNTHRCKDTALRQMQKLRAGGYLKLPRQQRQAEHADFNPYIYDLTTNAKDHLTDLGVVEPTVRPSGHWWHGYMTACVSGSIDIAATREDLHYIPAHEILAIRNASLAIPIGTRKLIPDQLFALNYGGLYRVFALEVDRGTEPRMSTAARKSLKSSINLYSEMIDRQVYKQHYGLKANLLVLWAFVSKTRMQGFLGMAAKSSPALVKSTLCQTLVVPEAFKRPCDSPFASAWIRPDQFEVRINAA